MDDGIVSSTRTLRASSDTTLRPDVPLPVERPMIGIVHPDLRTRCRDLEARIELLENALEIDRAHVAVLRHDVRDLHVRTISLVDEVYGQEPSRTGEDAKSQGKSKDSEDDAAEYDAMVLALSVFLIWITIGYRFLFT
jgi:hypothetical protein